jgi:hypothetical protein
MKQNQSPWLDWSYKAGIAGFSIALLSQFGDAVIQMSSEHGLLPEPNSILLALSQFGIITWFICSLIVWRYAWQLLFPRPLHENQYRSLILYYLMIVMFPIMPWFVIRKARQRDADDE